MIDPRKDVMEKRLKNVQRVIAVTGWKGGIGKSSVSTCLALALAKEGNKVGLLDLDFSGASDHVLLGLKENVFPEEIEGLDPPVVSGVKFMSIAYFAKDKAVALRGQEITDVILELLTVSRWSELDYLIIDMPPGIADTSLDVTRFIKKAELAIVTTPSRLSKEVMLKSLDFFKSLHIPIVGIIENMSRTGKAGEYPVKVLGSVPFDMDFEDTIGNPDKMLGSKFGKAITELTQKL
jgi:ATP-binding protein involved in chromosome partitioning